MRKIRNVFFAWILRGLTIVTHPEMCLQPLELMEGTIISSLEGNGSFCLYVSIIFPFGFSENYALSVYLWSS